MLDIRKNLSVIISLILALIAAALVYGAVKAMMPSVPVIVATRNISIGDSITGADIKVIKMAAGDVPTTACRQARDVEGRIVTRGPILQGDVVHFEHLSEDGSLLARLKSYAPAGWVASELPAGTSAGLQGIKAGDVVDIYGDAGLIAANAIVLSIPMPAVKTSDTSKQYNVAVPANLVAPLTDAAVHGKKLAIVLPGRRSPLLTDQSTAAGGGTKP